jgi:hypothetical protein
MLFAAGKGSVVLINYQAPNMESVSNYFISNRPVRCTENPSC